METSAKDSTNVEQAFKAMVAELMPSGSSVKSEDTNIRITAAGKPPKTSSGFC